MKSLPALLQVTVAGLLLAACSPKPSVMTPQEAQRVATLTERPSPRCVGRYLIDLPAAFVLNSEAATEVDGVKIDVRPMKEQLFRYALEGRTLELEQLRQIGTGLPHVRKILPLAAPTLGVIFDRAEAEFTGRLSRRLELLAWRDGYQIKGFIDATDTTFPEDQSDSIAKQLKTDVAEKLAVLTQLYPRIRGRRDDEIPTETGLCFANGFVAGEQGEQEDAAIAYELRGAPDVYFNFSTDTTLREDDTMLQRSRQISRDFDAAGAKTLRNGVRTDLKFLHFEEWLASGPTPSRVPGTLCLLHGNETGQDRSKPFLDFELLNGYRIPAPSDLSDDDRKERGLYKDLERATLSDAEAVAIWDKVTATLRPRPGAF